MYLRGREGSINTHHCSGRDVCGIDPSISLIQMAQIIQTLNKQYHRHHCTDIYIYIYIEYQRGRICANVHSNNDSTQPSHIEIVRMVVAVDTGVDIDMFVQCHACGLIGIWRLLSSVRIHHCAIHRYILPMLFLFYWPTLLPVSDLDLDYGTLYGIYNTIRMVSYLETVPDPDN
jgi:hypothetical protein